MSIKKQTKNTQATTPAPEATPKPRVLLPSDYKAIEQREAFARKAFRSNIPYKENDCTTLLKARSAVHEALTVMKLVDGDDGFLFLTEEIIGRCYKKIALKCHPDRPTGNEQVFQELVTASNFLKGLLPQLKK